MNPSDARNTARRAVFRNRCPGPRAHPREKERRFSCDAAARAIPPRGHLSGNAKRPEGAKLLGTRTLAAATAANGKKVRLAGTVWGRSPADCLTGLCLVVPCLAPRDGRRIGLPGCFLVPPTMQDELRRSIRLLRHQPTPVRHILSAADFGPWARGHYGITRPLRHYVLWNARGPGPKSRRRTKSKIPQGRKGRRAQVRGEPGARGHQTLDKPPLVCLACWATGCGNGAGQQGAEGVPKIAGPKAPRAWRGAQGFLQSAPRTELTALGRPLLPGRPPSFAARALCPARIAALAMSRAVRRPACSCRRPTSMSKSGGAARGTRHDVGAIPPCNIGLRGP